MRHPEAMIPVRDILFRRTVAEQIALALHRPSLIKSLPAQSLRMILLLTAVAILNAIDLAYTIYADSIGELHELNPLADFILKAGNANTLICFKAMMVLIGFSLLWKGRKSKWAVPACWVLLAAFTALAFLWCAWVRNVSGMLEMEMLLTAR